MCIGISGSAFAIDMVDDTYMGDYNMKKNLISIIVLGLVVANLVVSIMSLMTVSTASGKVTQLITDISSVLSLELTDDTVQLDAAGLTPDQIAVYNISEEMTIAFKMAEGDTTQHYCVVQVSLSMDTTNEDYAKYGTETEMQNKETLIRGIINDVISNHTIEEMQVGQQDIRDEILTQIQQLYGSKFIYQVNFTSYIPS